MTQSTWNQRMVAAVGEHVKQIRESKSPKLSAERLAERVSKLGYPYSRSALVNLEYGRKKTLEVTELLVIAEALDIPPVELLFPGLMTEQCEFLPGQFTTAWHSLKRFTGETDHGGVAMRDQREYRLSLMRELDKNQAQILESGERRKAALSAGDHDRVQFEESRIESARKYDELLKGNIRAAGYNVGDTDE